MGALGLLDGAELDRQARKAGALRGRRGWPRALIATPRGHRQVCRDLAPGVAPCHGCPESGGAVAGARGGARRPRRFHRGLCRCRVAGAPGARGVRDGGVPAAVPRHAAPVGNQRHERRGVRVARVRFLSGQRLHMGGVKPARPSTAAGVRPRASPRDPSTSCASWSAGPNGKARATSRASSSWASPAQRQAARLRRRSRGSWSGVARASDGTWIGCRPGSRPGSHGG